MEKTVSIPLKEAIEALWYINDCFGFRKPYAESAILLNSFSKGEYLRTPTITQDRISDLLENILHIDRNENHLVHLVLWLNANINHPGQEIIDSVNLFQGSRNATGHEKDLYKIRQWVSRISAGDKITLTAGEVGGKQTITLDNEHNWFLTAIDSWLPTSISGQDAGTALSQLKERTGSKASDERLCIAYGVFRFLREVGAINGERTSSLLHFIWMYLMEMNLEDTPYDPDLTDSLNVSIGRYDKRSQSGSTKGNYHYPKIPWLNITRENLSQFIIR